MRKQRETATEVLSEGDRKTRRLGKPSKDRFAKLRRLRDEDGARLGAEIWREKRRWLRNGKTPDKISLMELGQREETPEMSAVIV